MTVARPVCLDVYSMSLFDQLLIPPSLEGVLGTSFTHLRGDSLASPTPHMENLQAQRLSIVIEPSGVPPAQLARIPQPQIWWFVSPLQNQTTENQTRGARIGEFSRKWLAEYVRPLTAVRQSPKPLLIVGDTKSLEKANRTGFKAVVSPPAISDSVFHPASTPVRSAVFMTPPNPNVYQTLFTDRLSVPVHDFSPATFARSDAHVPSDLRFGISIGKSVLREFPILAAAHLAAGNALISEPLFPLHGLEPGIDYFEVTSPEELHHVSNYFEREPSAARLMAYRGRQKAEYFRASRVWPKILEELETLFTQ